MSTLDTLRALRDEQMVIADLIRVDGLECITAEYVTDWTTRLSAVIAEMEGAEPVTQRLDIAIDARRLSAIAPARPEGEGVQVINLDAISWESIKQAASESKWMPKEYFANDWESDVCLFLREGAEAFLPATPALDPPKVEAWMVRDEDGDANYIDRPPTDWEIEWAARYGKKWKPLVSAPSADAGEVERDAEWWSLVMGAAAALEDAANSTRDPDAARAAMGAAEHYRAKAKAIDAALRALLGAKS